MSTVEPVILILGLSVVMNAFALFYIARTCNPIDLRRPIKNKARKFGANPTYFRATCKWYDGKTVPLLLTEREVQVARQRALVNPEDVHEH